MVATRFGAGAHVAAGTVRCLPYRRMSKRRCPRGPGMLAHLHITYALPDEPWEVLKRRLQEEQAKAQDCLSKLTDEELMARIKPSPARETS